MANCAYRLADLRAAIRPFRLRFFPRLRSTSDHAALLRKRGQLFAPAVVLTSRQTRGRGRGGSTWWSGPGCLTATFVLPIEEHLATHQLPLAAGLAVRNAAAELTGDDRIALKWPNDVVWRGRKLAGVLCERVGRADLIGIGLNVNIAVGDAPGALRRRLASLLMVAGKPLDMTAVLACVATHLRQTMLRRRHHPFAAMLREYAQHHALTGRRISVVTNTGAITGICDGLDAMGHLLVRTVGGTRRVVSGTVRVGRG
jgi:BirA family biotin operon repressor/biotin-[acetyl-CoA-carboxylase] ligase